MGDQGVRTWTLSSVNISQSVSQGPPAFIVLPGVLVQNADVRAPPLTELVNSHIGKIAFRENEQTSSYMHQHR